MNPLKQSRDIRFVTSHDGVKLAMASSGAGPALIKAATWMTHINLRPPGTIIGALTDEFSKHHRFIEYDTRGCGLSERNVNDFTFEDWVKDLEAVADASGQEKFVLLGFTCAVGVAIEYAARHPERVSQLILYGGFATSYYSTSNPDPVIRREGDLMVELAALGWGNRSPAFRQVFISRFMPDATPEQRDAFDKWQCATSSAEVAAQYMKTMYGVNVKEAAAQVRCPTLVLHAKDDEMVSFSQGLRLASMIPGARLVPLPGRNHMPFPTEPAWEIFLQEARIFLGQDDAAMPSAQPVALLTKRQIEVMKKVASGDSDKQIAQQLSLSPRTVEMHVSAAIKVLQCKNRAEAVHQAMRQGYLNATS